LNNAQQLNLRKSSVSHDHNQAGLKETNIIESMRTVDNLTDQDGVYQIQTVHHATKATQAVLSKILSNDHTQANLSEQLQETEPTSSYNTNTSPEVQKSLQDQYDSIGAPKWNVVHGGTHQDFQLHNPSPSSLSGPSKDVSSSSALVMTSSYSNNISPEERQALQDLYDSTDGPNWYNGASWDFSNPNANPCDEGWRGVDCSDDYHIIISI